MDIDIRPNYVILKQLKFKAELLENMSLSACNMQCHLNLTGPFIWEMNNLYYRVLKPNLLNNELNDTLMKV